MYNSYKSSIIILIIFIHYAYVNNCMIYGDCYLSSLLFLIYIIIMLFYFIINYKKIKKNKENINNYLNNY